jgi:hypothetical protein
MHDQLEGGREAKRTSPISDRGSLEIIICLYAARWLVIKLTRPRDFLSPLPTKTSCDRGPIVRAFSRAKLTKVSSRCREQVCEFLLLASANLLLEMQRRGFFANLHCPS